MNYQSVATIAEWIDKHPARRRRPAPDVIAPEVTASEPQVATTEPWLRIARLADAGDCGMILVFAGTRGAEAMWSKLGELLAASRASGAAASETPTHKRSVLTLLFTDIVGATEHAERLGDEGWSSLLKRHHATVRAELARFAGREVDTAGDGFFAAFDEPTRAVRCAVAIRAAVHDLGLEIRAGLHSGECEIVGDRIVGVAVHIAARVAAAALAGDILVSSTVKDLVIGSRLAFASSGKHELKGVSGQWDLFSLSGNDP